jgi:hypothetical protein
MKQTDPQNETPTGPTDPDLSAALGAVDPGDKVEQIQSDTQKRIEEGTERERAEALKQVKVQDALREGFSYVNMIAQQLAPQLEHDEGELDNLAVLWSEVIKDVPEERLMRFVERMPLVAAGAYTVVTTGPKVRDAIQAYRRRQATGGGGATLEQPSTNNNPNP